MRWVTGCVCVCVLLWSAVGQEKSQAELAKLPMYERMLKGEDAKKAAKLESSVDEYLELQDFANARKVAEQLLNFRIAKQGADH